MGFLVCEWFTYQKSVMKLPGHRLNTFESSWRAAQVADLGLSWQEPVLRAMGVGLAPLDFARSAARVVLRCTGGRGHSQ